MENSIMYLCIGLTGYLCIDFLIKFLFSIWTRLKVEKILYQKRMNHKINYQYFKPVSILIPIENEDTSIKDCLSSVVNLNYNQFEIILIASSNQTEWLQCFIKENELMKVSRPIKKVLNTNEIDRIYEGKYNGIPITVVRKEQTVQTDDYNAGANVARYPYILTLKSNQKIEPDALKEFVRIAMIEENVILCAGASSKEYDKKNIFSLLETSREVKSFVQNICFNSWNGNLLISNSFCFLKKDFFLEAKGFSTKYGNTDSSFIARAHIFLKRQRKKYRICYVPTSNLIENCSNCKEFQKRKKEEKSIITQSILNHKKLFLNPSYGLLSILTYTYLLFFELLKPYLLILNIFCMSYLMILKKISFEFIGIVIGVYVVFYVLYYLINNSLRKKIRKKEKEVEEEYCHTIV